MTPGLRFVLEGAIPLLILIVTALGGVPGAEEPRRRAVLTVFMGVLLALAMHRYYKSTKTGRV